MRDQWTTNKRGRKILIRAKAKDPDKCRVVQCRNTRMANQHICSTCHRAEVRANNPLWAEWRDRAYRHTRRGIRGKDRPCCTYQEWLRFHATKPGPDYVVDRIDPLQGYTLDNMQWLTHADNATKGATFDKQAYAEHRRHRVVVFTDEAPTDADQDLVDATARLTTDYSEQFDTVTGDTNITFIPTDNEPF